MRPDNSNYNAYSFADGTRRPGIKYWIVFFTTVILLAAMLISLIVVLCVGNDNKPSGDFDDNGGNVDKAPNNNTKPIKGDSGIVLPCSTPDKKYLAASNASAATIEGISSEAAVLVSATKGTVIAQKQADTVIHPASMTKIMTILVAVENAKNPKALVTAKKEMFTRMVELEGSGVIVENTVPINEAGDALDAVNMVGKSLKLEDALHFINYKSDTVCCLMVAEHIAGSEAEFVKLMNAKAAALGLTKTNFVNSTGLTEANGAHNTTTAREMAAIMNAVMNNETANAIVTSFKEYRAYIYDGKTKTSNILRSWADWYSKNTRLNDNPYVTSNILVCGGKTGYEDIPESCFVTYAKNVTTQEIYICVTVGRLKETSTGSKNEDWLVAQTSTSDTIKVYRDYAK